VYLHLQNIHISSSEKNTNPESSNFLLEYEEHKNAQKKVSNNFLMIMLVHLLGQLHSQQQLIDASSHI
jgi:hypothetical protein